MSEHSRDHNAKFVFWDTRQISYCPDFSQGNVAVALPFVDRLRADFQRIGHSLNPPSLFDQLLDVQFLHSQLYVTHNIRKIMVAKEIAVVYD